MIPVLLLLFIHVWILCSNYYSRSLNRFIESLQSPNEITCCQASSGWSSVLLPQPTALTSALLKMISTGLFSSIALVLFNRVYFAKLKTNMQTTQEIAQQNLSFQRPKARRKCLDLGMCLRKTPKAESLFEQSKKNTTSSRLSLFASG